MSLQVGSRLDPALVVGQRWLASPGRPVRDVSVEEQFPIPGGGSLALLRIELDDGRSIHCSWPLDPAGSPADGSEVVAGGVPWRGLFDLAGRGGVVAGSGGMRLVGVAPRSSPEPRRVPGSPRTVRPLGADQTHTSVVIDDSTVLKLYRRLTPGIGPEVELAVALAGDESAPVPAFRGALRIVDARGRRRWDLAVAQRYLADAPDEFERFAERIAAWLRAGAPRRALSSLTSDAAPIGVAVARLHASLGRLDGRGRAPRLETAADRDRRRRRAARAYRSAVRLLRPLDPAMARWIVTRRPAIEAALAVPADPLARVLQRIHADLHVGQLLLEGDRFLFTDLEGDPIVPMADRRRPDLPLRDLASMLRSFDHVARSGMRRAGHSLDAIAAGTSPADAAIDAWLGAMRTAFLTAYGAVDLDANLLLAFEVEKELSEFVYAATYLPWWRYAPAAGLRWLLDRGPSNG